MKWSAASSRCVSQSSSRCSFVVRDDVVVKDSSFCKLRAAPPQIPHHRAYALVSSGCAAASAAARQGGVEERRQANISAEAAPSVWTAPCTPRRSADGRGNERAVSWISCVAASASLRLPRQSASHTRAWAVGRWWFLVRSGRRK